MLFGKILSYGVLRSQMKWAEMFSDSEMIGRIVFFVSLKIPVKDRSTCQLLSLFSVSMRINENLKVGEITKWKS